MFARVASRHWLFISISSLASASYKLLLDDSKLLVVDVDMILLLYPIDIEF